MKRPAVIGVILVGGVIMLSAYWLLVGRLVSIDSSQQVSIKNSEALLTRNDPDLTLIADSLHSTSFTHKVIKQQTLSEVFQLYGLNPDDLLAMIKANPQAIQLREGQVIEWQQDELGRILELAIHRNATLSSRYLRQGTQFVFQPTVTQGTLKSLVRHGYIRRNFYQAAKQAGLNNVQIQTVANALYWFVDVTQPDVIGDQFAVELQQPWVGQHPMASGKIAAIWFKHQGKNIQLVRFSDDKFYDMDGVSVEKSLNRWPFTQTFPVSSSFDPHRLNPVTQHYAPHYGTDFATPVGTPVVATGDGVVMKVGRHTLAGKFVVLQNGRKFSTHFFHLSQILVNQGDFVKRGQVIALTGNTGRSTGPHLHYELRQHGQPIDAMLAPLPQRVVLTKQQKIAFEQQAHHSMSLLQTYLKLPISLN